MEPKRTVAEIIQSNIKGCLTFHGVKNCTSCDEAEYDCELKKVKSLNDALRYCIDCSDACNICALCELTKPLVWQRDRLQDRIDEGEVYAKCEESE